MAFAEILTPLIMAGLCVAALALSIALIAITLRTLFYAWPLWLMKTVTFRESRKTTS